MVTANKLAGRPRTAISYSEGIWLLVTSTLVMALTTVPYWVGYSQQDSTRIFGGAILDRPDYNVYVAGIQAGLHGISYYPMLHSPEQAAPVYLRLFYVWVGLLGRGGTLSAQTLYEIARWSCGLLALLVMYLFAAYLFRPVILRRFTWILFVFGSGVGWLMVLGNWFPHPGIAPADFSQLDLIGFLTLLLTPHFALTEALQWAMALAFLNGWGNSKRWLWWVGLGVVFSVMTQTIQVYAPLTLDIALGLYALLHWIAQRRIIWRELGSLLGLALAQLPWTLYSFWVFQNDPTWHSYYLQNVLLSPPALDYALALGAVGLLAVIGLKFVLAKRPLGAWHLIGLWVVVVVAAVYWPSQLQRRFVVGGFGPLAILATIGMVKGVWPLARRSLRTWRPNLHRVRGLLFGLTLLFVAQSNVWLLLGITVSIENHLPIYFDSADEWDAMRWLGAHTNWQDPVFADLSIGNTIPAAIGHRVYVGHWAESVDYTSRLSALEAFYRRETSDPERYAILRDGQSRYLFYGPRERELGPFQPDQAAYLRQVYRNSTVTIYEIIAF